MSQERRQGRSAKAVDWREAAHDLLHVGCGLTLLALSLVPYVFLGGEFSPFARIGQVILIVALAGLLAIRLWAKSTVFHVLRYR